MKLLPVFIVCAFSGAVFLRAAPLPAHSRITAVTVYTDRAVVTRTADLELTTAGTVDLVFDRLPASLDPASLAAAGAGTADATLVDVTARPVHVDTTPNERVKSLEDELRDVAKQDRILADRATVLGQQRDYVLHIQTATTTPGKDSVSAAPAPDVWSRLLAFSEEQLGRIAAENQSIDEQRADLRARRTALEQQLGELRGAGDRAYQSVTVRLAATTTGHLSVTLRYAVPDASWRPSYDVRARSSARTAQLAYAGLVRQNTGEDWSGIDLTLSTARPSLGGAAPALDPWIVQTMSRPDPMATAINPDDTVVLSPFAAAPVRDEGYAAKSTMAGTRVRGLALRSATVTDAATSATFHLAGASDVPADNAPHKLGITSISLVAEPSYRAAPKLVPSAFLTAKVTNSSEFPLLAGALNVFLDDTFVAATTLRTTMPGEAFDLALGADDGITLKRKLNNRFVEDTGLVNKGHRITYDFTLAVENHKPAAVHLTLVDQVPVSRHEKIVVKVSKPDERELKPEADGTLTWSLDLKPGEKRELPLKFSIEYPADLPVIGLD